MGPASRDTDPRLLRAFTAVAEELHFTRAAARPYVAQQALSRDIRRLEHEWRTTLFVRSTRQVALTPDGERLLPHARRVLAAYQDLAAAVSSGRTGRSSSTSAPPSRPGSGCWTPPAGPPPGWSSSPWGAPPIERVAVLLPEDHPLAGRARLPLAALAGETLYAGAGNAETAEWTDFARRLFAGRGVALAAPFPRIEGEPELRRIVRRQGWSVLASEVALTDAARELAAEGGWLPEPDRRLLDAPETQA